MKKGRWVVPLLLLAALGPALGGEAAEDRFDRLLAKYVAIDGVRYDAWRDDVDDSSALSAVVTDLSRTDPDELSADERYALYINLYNAKVVQLVLQHDPPRSIRDVTRAKFGWGVFFKKYLWFDGERYSLNKLEKRLREESNDPRVHFAVNCASRSCPPLLERAYRAADLDSTLDERTRGFLAASGNLRLEQAGSDNRPLKLRVSKIFDWFAGDFAPAGGVVEFIRAYAPEEIAARLGEESRIKLAYLEYDWTLNRASAADLSIGGATSP